MSSTSATIPSWEQKILDLPLSGPSLDMASMNSLDASKTAGFGASMYKEYYPVPENVKNQLTSINIATVQNVETATRTAIDTIQGLKKTHPDRDAWRATIRSAYETAKQSFSTRFDDASDEAVKTIKALPPVRQDAAANFFSHGLNFVNTIIYQASGGILDINAWDLLAGNWNKLVEVDNNIKAGCGAAIDALKSML